MFELLDFAFIRRPTWVGKAVSFTH